MRESGKDTPALGVKVGLVVRQWTGRPPVWRPVGTVRETKWKREGTFWSSSMLRGFTFDSAGIPGKGKSPEAFELGVAWDMGDLLLFWASLCPEPLGGKEGGGGKRETGRRDSALMGES